MLIFFHKNLRISNIFCNFIAIRMRPKNLHITIHYATKKRHSKLDGLISISTSKDMNKLCKARALVEGGVCSRCYVNHFMFPSVEKNLTANYELLHERVFSPEEWESGLNIGYVPSGLARIESFGDVDSIIQAANYINIIRAFPGLQWGIWSKSLHIWMKAFEQYGKPDNCTFVYSSFLLNRYSTIPTEYMKYIDHLFTVYDKQHVMSADINCGGRSCKECRLCYRKDSVFHIHEQLK